MQQRRGLSVEYAMNVIEIASFGGPDVLRLGQRPVPVAGPGEVLIRVSASGVNRPDVLQRSGLYPAPPGASDILGLEIAGTVVAGDAVALEHANLQVGDRVCALVAGGGYAEFCVAPVAQCLPVPDGLSDIEAASLPETFFTVWSNVFDRGCLQSGETLLIQGGSSGIGVTAIQLAKAFGATVIVTAGSDAKCQACLALGADHAINYKTQDFQSEVLRLTDGRGVNVVLDMVAGDYIAKELGCMAEDGRLVIIAVQGGVQGEINAGLVMRKRLTVTGSTLRPRPIAFKQAIAQACLQRVWPLIVAGRIKPVVHSVFNAQDAEHASGSGASRAHALMESNQHVGKIVLTWGTA
jgi:NADPH2:quinone reductase